MVRPDAKVKRASMADRSRVLRHLVSGIAFETVTGLRLREVASSGIRSCPPAEQESGLRKDLLHRDDSPDQALHVLS